MFTSSQTGFSTVLAYLHRLRDRKKMYSFLLMFFFFRSAVLPAVCTPSASSATVSYWLLSFSALVWLAQRCVAHTAHVFSMWTARRCFSRHMFSQSLRSHFGLLRYFSVFLLSFRMRSSFFIIWFIFSEYHWPYLWQGCYYIIVILLVTRRHLPLG